MKALALFAALCTSVVFAGSAQAQTLDGFAEAITVKEISQYQNLMPVILDPGQPMPNRTYTTITFEVERCGAPLAEQFEIASKIKDETQIVKITTNPLTGDCKGPTRRREVSITTNKLVMDKAIVVVNPVIVTILPAAH